VTRGSTFEGASCEMDWERLTREFLEFKGDEESCRHDSSLFVKALVNPVPGFARYLLEKRVKTRGDYPESVRTLYGFLLEKRYKERLNLLHFAFLIFEEESTLPEEIIAQTPFPHEEGIPSFRYHKNPDSVLSPPRSSPSEAQ
jgi:hypothetical protein